MNEKAYNRFQQYGEWIAHALVPDELAVEIKWKLPRHLWDQSGYDATKKVHKALPAVPTWSPDAARSPVARDTFYLETLLKKEDRKGKANFSKDVLAFFMKFLMKRNVRFLFSAWKERIDFLNRGLKSIKSLAFKNSQKRRGKRDGEDHAVGGKSEAYAPGLLSALDH